MRLIAVLLLALLSSGCGLLYKQSIQQGNVLEAEQVDALKPGMTKRQVMLVLGTPAVESPFHDSRWDYVSSYKDEDGKLSLKRLTVIFDDSVLTRIEGDYNVGKSKASEDPAAPAEDADSPAAKSSDEPVT